MPNTPVPMEPTQHFTNNGSKHFYSHFTNKIPVPGGHQSDLREPALISGFSLILILPDDFVFHKSVFLFAIYNQTNKESTQEHQHGNQPSNSNTFQDTNHVQIYLVRPVVYNIQLRQTWPGCINQRDNTFFVDIHFAGFPQHIPYLWSNIG